MDQKKRRIIRARDVMYTKVVSIDGMATAREAAEKMRAEKVPSLLVDKRHQDDEWGILVVQDFITTVIIPGCSPDEVNVYEMMTKPVLTVPGNMDVRYVARLLYRSGIRRAPVVENSEIVGMLSLSNLIRNGKLF
jgi:signal-transduction protein with cAMP-binding, CBS, and nucleotidyltransferase domain